MATWTPVPAEHFIPDPTPLGQQLLELRIMAALAPERVKLSDLTLPRLRRLEREARAALEARP